MPADIRQPRHRAGGWQAYFAAMDERVRRGESYQPKHREPPQGLLPPYGGGVEIPESRTDERGKTPGLAATGSAAGRTAQTQTLPKPSDDGSGLCSGESRSRDGGERPAYATSGSLQGVRGPGVAPPASVHDAADRATHQPERLVPRNHEELERYSSEVEAGQHKRTLQAARGMAERAASSLEREERLPLPAGMEHSGRFVVQDGHVIVFREKAGAYAGCWFGLDAPEAELAPRYSLYDAIADALAIDARCVIARDGWDGWKFRGALAGKRDPTVHETDAGHLLEHEARVLARERRT